MYKAFLWLIIHDNVMKAAIKLMQNVGSCIFGACLLGSLIAAKKICFSNFSVKGKWCYQFTCLNKFMAISHLLFICKQVLTQRAICEHCISIIKWGLGGTHIKNVKRAPNIEVLGSKYELHLLYFTTLTLPGSSPSTGI